MILAIKELFFLLEKKQKRDVPIILVLMLFGSIIETFSVSMLVPVISIIINSSEFENNFLYKKFCQLFSIDNINNSLIVICFFIIAALFIIKNCFLYFQISYQSKFASDVRQKIQKKMYNACLNKPYKFYLATNTGNILRNIYVDSMGLYNSLLSITTLFMESIIFISFVITLFIIDMKISIMCVSVIFIIFMFIYLFIKPRMLTIGRKYSESSGCLNQWIIQSTDNIKEIKVMQREPYFIHIFNKECNIYNDASRKNQIWTGIPRLIIETGAITGILVILGIVYLCGNNIGNSITKISVFAVAATRLLPSFNRISNSVNAILFNEPALNNIKEFFAMDEDKKNIVEDIIELPELHKEIVIKNVSYRYADSDYHILSDINLIIKKGETIGLIGESGSGKTTFVNLILGLLEPENGDILWDGIKTNSTQKRYHMNIGYIPQQISLLDDTIEANIIFGNHLIDKSRVTEVIEEAQLGCFIHSLPKGVNTNVGERGIRLSGGQRQRIGIARALYSNPDFIVLDEATSALDYKTEKELMDSINSLHGKKTMIIIAHRLSTLNKCDRIYKLNEGNLFQQ